MRAGWDQTFAILFSKCMFIYSQILYMRRNKKRILNVSSQGSLEILSCPQAAKNNVSHIQTTGAKNYW